MSKLTPTPWRLEYYKDSDYIQCHRVVGPGEYDLVCDNEGYYPKAVSEADARLIAAAPDLLEALQYVVKRIEDSWEWWMGVEERGGFDVEKLNAVIAKATGEQP